jgi:drug/metabolite transporter (DMT)-like permease
LLSKNAGAVADPSRLRGIVCMLIAVFAFTVLDTMMKYLGQRYSLLQVSALRGAASLPFIVMLAFLTRRESELLPKRWGLQIARGLLTVVTLVLFVYGLRTLSLSGAYAIFLCAPLCITAFSVVLLRERVDWQRWLAIIGGFVGVVVLLKPTSNEMISIAALAVLAATICYALGAIMIRQLSKTETTLSISFTFLLVIAVVASVLAAPQWQHMPVGDTSLVFLLGLSGAAGQYFMVEAYRCAPASVIAPFDYTQLLWAMLFDWLLWQTIPQTRMLFGAAVVIFSGLYLIFRERKSAPLSPSML